MNRSSCFSLMPFICVWVSLSPSHLISLFFKCYEESEHPSAWFQLTPVSAPEWETRPQKTSILPSPTHAYPLGQMKDTKQDLMHTRPPWLHLRADVWSCGSEGRDARSRKRSAGGWGMSWLFVCASDCTTWAIRSPEGLLASFRDAKTILQETCPGDRCLILLSERTVGFVIFGVNVFLQRGKWDLTFYTQDVRTV